MSIHERIYEGILSWPVKITAEGVACIVGKDRPSPRWEDEEGPETDPCGAVLLGLEEAVLDPKRLLDAVETHMYDDHHHVV
jgi:hypothetical protein